MPCLAEASPSSAAVPELLDGSQTTAKSADSKILLLGPQQNGVLQVAYLQPAGKSIQVASQQVPVQCAVHPSRRGSVTEHCLCYAEWPRCVWTSPQWRTRRWLVFLKCEHTPSRALLILGMIWA